MHQLRVDDAQRVDGGWNAYPIYSIPGTFWGSAELTVGSASNFWPGRPADDEITAAFCFEACEMGGNGEKREAVPAAYH
jgi:hypothetical protein